MVSRVFLGMMALALAAVLYLSDRPVSLMSAPRVAEIVVLPDDPRLASVRRYTEIGSGILPHASRRAAPEATLRPPLRLGWSYRELSILGMPLWASTDNGFVTYLELPAGVQVALINDAQLALLEEMTGERYAGDYNFPWYLHLWGWLLPLGLLVWHLLASRDARRAEGAEFHQQEFA